MSFDLQKILADKRALRRDLAARPIEQKLRILDALRERELAIRGRSPHANAGLLREEPPPLSHPASMTKPEKRAAD